MHNLTSPSVYITTILFIRYNITSLSILIGRKKNKAEKVTKAWTLPKTSSQSEFMPSKTEEVSKNVQELQQKQRNYEHIEKPCDQKNIEKPCLE